MTVSPDFNTALSASFYTAFTAVQIDLPTYEINLLTSAGFVSFPVNGVATTFSGSDPVYGTLASVGTVGASMASEAPRVTLTLLPPTDEAVGSLCNPRVQQSPIRVYEGAVDPTSGNVLGTPKQVWSGFLDQAFVQVSQGQRSVEVESGSALEKFLQSSEGERLTTTWQTLHFPGQTGLRHNVAATREIVWGKEGISSGFAPGTTGGTTYGGGGGYGGGGDVTSWAF